MSEMLTAKDVQGLLQVDRSTVYRMAENGRLPAIKVGKQWRFPVDQLEDWFGSGITSSPTKVETKTAVAPLPDADDLQSLLPLECVELIQNSHADLLGVMVVITDMNGVPITTPSNPCSLFQAVTEMPDVLQKCILSWHDLANDLSFEPRFQITHLGMLCARAFIRVGAELKGMVVAGCVAPENWPPAVNEVVDLAAEFDMDPGKFSSYLDGAYRLDPYQKATVLDSVQKIANIVAHIVQERQMLVGKLDAISNLAKL